MPEPAYVDVLSVQGATKLLDDKKLELDAAAGNVAAAIVEAGQAKTDAQDAAGQALTAASVAGAATAATNERAAALNDGVLGLDALSAALAPALDEIAALTSMRAVVIEGNSVSLVDTVAANLTPSTYIAAGGYSLPTVTVDVSELGQVHVVRAEPLADLMGQMKQTQSAFSGLQTVFQSNATSVLTQTQARIDAAIADAVAWANVDPRYISLTTANPTALGSEGVIGTRLDDTGMIVRLLSQGGAWVQVGTPIMSLGSFTLRQGLNIWDYFNYKSGDDWTPAINKMLDDAQVMQRVTMPIGKYIQRGQVQIKKPVLMAMRGAEMLVTGRWFDSADAAAGAAFALQPMLDAQGVAIPYKVQGNPIDGLKPAWLVSTTVGNGSFGDNASFGMNNTIHGDFPDLTRVDNGDVQWKDGSCGLLMNNCYWPRYRVGAIRGFHFGHVLDSYKTGSGVRGNSHHVAEYDRMENIWNLLYNGRASSVGWNTSNHHMKGSWGTPQGQSGKTIPDDHFHVVILANNGESNVIHFDGCGFEGSVRRALVSVGHTRFNSMDRVRTEMPFAVNGRSFLFLQNRDGGTAYGWDLRGITPNQIEGILLYSGTSTVTYGGKFDSYDGIAGVAAAQNGYIKPGTREWYPKGPQPTSILFYQGTETPEAPLILNMADRRNFAISSAFPIAPRTICLVNAPKLTDWKDLRIAISQGSSVGQAVDPQFLRWSQDDYTAPAAGQPYLAPTNMVDLTIGYGIYPQPVKRGYGTDIYDFEHFLSAYYGRFGESRIAVANHRTYDYTPATPAAATTPALLAARTTLTYSGTPITVDLATTAQTRYVISVQTDMPAGSIIFTNTPAGEIDFDLRVFQGSGGFLVHPNFVKYGAATVVYWPEGVSAPRKRHFGRDTLIARGSSDGFEVRAKGSLGTPGISDGAAYAGSTLPTMQSQRALEFFFHSTEKQLYTTDAQAAAASAWRPVIPAASSTVGGTVKKIVATATLDFPSIAAGGNATLTMSVPGAVVGDYVILGGLPALEAGLVPGVPRVSAADTVTIRLNNITAAAIDPAAIQYGVQIIR